MARDFGKSCISPTARKVFSTFCCSNVNATEATTKAYSFITVSSHAKISCLSVTSQNPSLHVLLNRADGTEALCMC